MRRFQPNRRQCIRKESGHRQPEFLDTVEKFPQRGQVECIAAHHRHRVAVAPQGRQIDGLPIRTPQGPCPGVTQFGLPHHGLCNFCPQGFLAAAYFLVIQAAANLPFEVIQASRKGPWLKRGPPPLPLQHVERRATVLRSQLRDPLGEDHQFDALAHSPNRPAMLRRQPIETPSGAVEERSLRRILEPHGHGLDPQAPRLEIRFGLDILSAGPQALSGHGPKFEGQFSAHQTQPPPSHERPDRGDSVDRPLEGLLRR